MSDPIHPKLAESGWAGVERVRERIEDLRWEIDDGTDEELRAAREKEIDELEELLDAVEPDGAYTTTEVSDMGDLRDGAELEWHPTRKAAKACAEEDGRRLYPEEDREEPGYRMEVVPLVESDAWAKLPAEWSDRRVKEWAAENGCVNSRHLIVKRPGSHPGLPKIWVSLRKDVFAAVIEAVEVAEVSREAGKTSGGAPPPPDARAARALGSMSEISGAAKIEEPLAAEAAREEVSTAPKEAAHESPTPKEILDVFKWFVEDEDTWEDYLAASRRSAEEAAETFGPAHHAATRREIAALEFAEKLVPSSEDAWARGLGSMDEGVGVVEIERLLAAAREEVSAAPKEEAGSARSRGIGL